MAAVIQTLEVDSVILEFGTRRILQDVYLKCETNRIVGLLGRNGSGKSCLMNIIYGHLKPLNGSVRINGRTLLRNSRSPAELMYLPQFHFIPGHLTLKRIFMDFLLDFGPFGDSFPDFAKYYQTSIGRLSGGERRIVEIYLVLCSVTKFSILDEPFSHIMPVHIETVKRLMEQERKKKGILLTDHLYNHLIGICDPVYLLKDGKTHAINQLEDVETLGYANLKNG